MMLRIKLSFRGDLRIGSQIHRSNFNTGEEEKTSKVLRSVQGRYIDGATSIGSQMKFSTSEVISSPAEEIILSSFVSNKSKLGSCFFAHSGQGHFSYTRLSSQTTIIPSSSLKKKWIKKTETPKKSGSGFHVDSKGYQSAANPSILSLSSKD